MKGTILVVDDEKNIREGLKKSLELDGFNAQIASDGEEALTIFENETIDLIITDLKMPNMSGEKLLKKIIQLSNSVPVIILTGHGTVENAVDTMREGAYDFLTKPVNLKKLTLIIKRALANKQLEIENRELHKQLDEKYGFSNIIGNSLQIQKVFDVVKQVAPSNANILITGENGTGKELIANAIHRLSNRHNCPLIKVHCAALSENLLESELFGHEKGSFTGAISQKKGRFELADCGTIFLDEIGEISPLLQVKLLRVLQEREFERVGGEKTIKVNVRLIAATNKNLLNEVEKGNFREDLYFRLNVISIHIPSLRERKSDIPLLVDAFIKEFGKTNNKDNLTITSKALSYLENYNWPGNIRELRNIIESAVVMSRGNSITEDLLPNSITGSKGNNIINVESGMSLEDIEKNAIISTLAMTKGNKTQAAKILKIGRKTLHRKLEEYKIE
ncbi:MAG: sigma-54 dependent transcriptional regulator [Spirochaetota bacterium]|nr:sigma-54 dependent transcriptional regulator [Spirochaetota bacterium]